MGWKKETSKLCVGVSGPLSLPLPLSLCLPSLSRSLTSSEFLLFFIFFISFFLPSTANFSTTTRPSVALYQTTNQGECFMR